MDHPGCSFRKRKKRPPLPVARTSSSSSIGPTRSQTTASRSRMPQWSSRRCDGDVVGDEDDGASMTTTCRRSSFRPTRGVGTLCLAYSVSWLWMTTTTTTTTTGGGGSRSVAMRHESGTAEFVDVRHLTYLVGSFVYKSPPNPLYGPPSRTFLLRMCRGIVAR